MAGGWLSSIFGQDYGASYALDIQDPNNQEPLVYRAYAEGTGGDIVPRADVPEDITLQSWGARVQAADQVISSSIRGPLNTLAKAVQPYAHELGNSNPIDMINIEAPDFADVEIINFGLWDMEARIAMDIHAADEGANLSAKQDALNSVREAIEQMNTIIESPEYSDLNAVQIQMRERGFDYDSIHNTLSPGAEAMNSPIPTLPQPGTF